MARVPADMTTKYLLSEKEMPTEWYNSRPTCRARCRRRCTRAPASRSGPQDLAPLFPHGADQAGGEPGAVDRDPRRGPRRLPALAADAALPRAPAREGARHAGPHLLQVRGRQPGRQPQAQHRRGPGLLQQAGGRRRGSATETGAGQWGSALALACKLFGLECKVYMVKVTLSAEALPAVMMETWGAQVVASPSPETQRRPEDPRAGSGFAGLPRHRHQRGGRGRRHPRRHQVLAGQRAQPRAAAPDGHRPGGQEAVRDGRRLRRTSSSAASAAARNFAGLAFPFVGDKLAGKNKKCASSPSSRAPARA